MPLVVVRRITDVEMEDFVVNRVVDPHLGI